MSDVARIKERIEKERQAMDTFLHSGLIQGVSKHRFITARMERIGGLMSDLSKEIGFDSAIEFVSSELEKTQEKPMTLAQMREKTGFDLIRAKEETNIPSGIIAFALIGKPIPKEHAEKLEKWALESRGYTIHVPAEIKDGSVNL